LELLLVLIFYNSEFFIDRPLLKDKGGDGSGKKTRKKT